MKALEIYEQDRAARTQGQAQPRQQYYASLRDALYRELMQQGYSDFLEQMLLELRDGLDRIYVLDYAALMECHSMIVLGRDMRDAAEFVPHLHLRGEKARWAVLEGPGNFQMPVAREMNEKLRQLRAVSRQLVDVRDEAVIPQADDAAQREIEQVHMLNKMLDDRCRALQQERDELQERLRKMEEGVISDQVRYAIEARKLQEEAALRETYAAQKAAASEAYRAQFAGEMAEDRDRREADARLTQSLREEAADQYAAIRRDMGEDLRQVVTLLNGQIERWQAALDRSECRMLAQTYTALYGLWAEDVTRLVLDAQESDAQEPLLAGLAELRSALGDRLRQLEQAMLRLGMVIIRPAAGEIFQPALHFAAGAQDGAEIARCTRPGVMLRGAQEALIRAEVETA